MSTDIVSRFEAVRETGPGRWLARCPAHDDRSPSLSVRLLDDGKWLLHCFAGCSPSDVLAAIGLTFADLFPGKAEHYRPPVRTRISASEALAALDHEAHVVAIIAADFLEYREIDEATWQRLATATQRIGDARALCCPARRAA